MTKHERVNQIVFAVLDELNRQLPKAQQLEKSEDTVLFGRSGKLDSLGVVNLVVIIEQKVEDEFSVAIDLADEQLMSQRNSPFRTVGTLADHISSLLEQKGLE